MADKTAEALRKASAYTASITREQFMFYETRTTAKLLAEGIEEEAAISHIADYNLFQYPTEKYLRKIARACIRRLNALNDDGLVKAIAMLPSHDAKQICLYAMMKQNRLVWDFMITVIGGKFSTMNYAYSKLDLNSFFFALQEQDGGVASWSESTVIRAKQVLNKLLVENEYIDNVNAERLNPVLINRTLEEAIRRHRDTAALPAFNCLI